MIHISLTDFIDYVSKVGTTKYTKVVEIHKRDEYQPAFDFWKPLREGIIEMHKKGKSKNVLDDILNNLTDKNKINRYPSLIKSYQSFLGRKKIGWFDPPTEDWVKDDLVVKLNPELGLEIDNKLMVIKLYFKSEKLSQAKADLILLLMNTVLKDENFENVTFAILDIERKKLFDSTKLTDVHVSLLEGEAMSFQSVWNSLEN